MPVGPFDTWDECIDRMTGEVDDPEAFCGWLKAQSAKLQVEPGAGVLPDAYRPADSPDVPAGRSCANCVFFVDDAEVPWCNLWDAQVAADGYCDAWSDGSAGYVDPNEMVVVETFDADREMLVITDGRLRAATLVPIPALVEAKLDTVDEDGAWRGTLAVEGVPTGDGRIFAEQAVSLDDGPWPLLWARQMMGGHDGAVVVGTIDEAWREGQHIMGAGRFDMDSEDGREAARQVREGISTGVSVDLDDVSLEVRVAADLLETLDVEVVASVQPWRLTAAVDSDRRTPTQGMAEEAQRALDWRAEGHQGGEENTVRRARSIAAREPLSADTIRRMHAFFSRNVRYPDLEGFSPGDDGYPSAARVAWGLWGGDAGRTWAASLVDRLEEGSLTASAVPASRFDDPRLSGPTALTVTDDGRVFGHLALWGTCHTGFANECVQPPPSHSDYAFFHTGTVDTDQGQVAVGRITVDTVHAGRRLAAADTSAHYEHTGLLAALVRAGEDEHGIWVSGIVAPGISDDQLARLKASPLSGDWRSVGGRLELVAALAVNSPGFPVPRALVASGRVWSLQTSAAPSDRSDQAEVAARTVAVAKAATLRRGA